MELFKPEFGLVFWMFFVFVVLFAILAKYAWPYIGRSSTSANGYYTRSDADEVSDY